MDLEKKTKQCRRDKDWIDAYASQRKQIGFTE